MTTIPKVYNIRNLGCHADWVDLDKIGADGQNAEHYPNIGSLGKCKIFCESNFTCSSIDWILGSSRRGGWVYNYPYDTSKIHSLSSNSHHVVDRKFKSVERFIGNGEICVLTNLICLNVLIWLAYFIVTITENKDTLEKI